MFEGSGSWKRLTDRLGSTEFLAKRKLIGVQCFCCVVWFLHINWIQLGNSHFISCHCWTEKPRSISDPCAENTGLKWPSWRLPLHGIEVNPWCLRTDLQHLSCQNGAVWNLMGFIEFIMVLHLQSVCKNPSFQTMPQHRPLSVVSPGRVSRLEGKGSGLWTTKRCNGDMAHTQAKWTREVQGELVSRKFISMFRPKGASVQELVQNDLIEPDLWNKQFDTIWFSSYLSFVHSLISVHFSFLRVFLHLIHVFVPAPAALVWLNLDGETGWHLPDLFGWYLQASGTSYKIWYQKHDII